MPDDHGQSFLLAAYHRSHRLSRGQKTLLLSFMVALALHAVLVAFSFRIFLFGLAGMRARTASLFKVSVRNLAVPSSRPVIEHRISRKPVLTPEMIDRILDEAIRAPRVDLEGDRFKRALEEKLKARQIGKSATIEPLHEEDVALAVVKVDSVLLKEDIDVSMRRLLPQREETYTITHYAAEDLPSAAGFAGTAGMTGRGTGAELGLEPETLLAKESRQLFPGARAAPVLDLRSRLDEEEAAILEEREELRKYETLDDIIRVELLTYRPGGERGYFMLRASVREDARSVPVMSKEIVFVIDASKSIGDVKLEKSKKAVVSCIRDLNEGDRFNVVAFKEDTYMFRPTTVPATPLNVAQAAEFIRKLRSVGSTDVFRAMLPLMQQQSAVRPYDIVLISDGRPTVGERDSRTIINSLTKRNDLNAAIFAFGGGTSPDEYLLSLLAYRNKGRARIEQQIPRMDDALVDFYRELRDPVLIDLRSNYGSIKEEDIFPKVLPDLHRKGDLIILGRFEEEKQFALRLVGQTKEGKREVVFRTELPERDNGDASIARLWAFQKIIYLIEQMTVLGSDPELIEEIALLSKKYDVPVPFDTGP